MGSVTFTLMVITVISKVTGMIREIVFGAAFGTGSFKDIYVVSESIRAICFGFLFAAIQACFIPIYNRILKEKGRAAADAYTSNLTNILLVLATVVIALGILFMGPIVQLIAGGFTGQKFLDTVYYARIAMFEIYFQALNVCFISYLNIHGSFSVPAITGILMNAILLLFAVLASHFNSLGLLAIGTVCAGGFKYIFFPSAIKKTNFRYRLRINWHSPYIRQTLAIAIPIMFSVVIQDISVLIDKRISTSLVMDGGASALDYADKLFQLVSGIVIVSIATAVYPQLSKLGQNGETKNMLRLNARSIVLGQALIIPASVAMMIFAKPVVRMFFERGAFNAHSTAMTAGALFWYTPGLIFWCFSTMATRCFYSVGDTKTPVMISFVQVSIDVIFNFILSAFFGLNGLAASTTLGLGVGAGIYLLLLRKKLGTLEMGSAPKSLLKITILSLGVGWIGNLLFTCFAALPEVLALFLTIAICGILYLVAILFLRIPEIVVLLNAGYRKWRRRAIHN